MKTARTILFCLAIQVFHFTVSAQEEIFIDDEIKLLKISENAFIHITFKEIERYGNVPANGLIYFENGNGVMIDTPWNNEQTARLLNFLKKEYGIEISDVIVTHWHEDCQGGLEEIKKQGINSYSCSLTKEIAKSKNLPVAENTFSKNVSIKFESTKIICKYLGGGHAKDNIFVWIPKEKMLFGGCCVKAANARNLGNTADADLEAWPNTIDKAKKQFAEAKIVIPGHGQIGGMELLEHTSKLLSER